MNWRRAAGRNWEPFLCFHVNPTSIRVLKSTHQGFDSVTIDT